MDKYGFEERRNDFIFNGLWIFIYCCYPTGKGECLNQVQYQYIYYLSFVSSNSQFLGPNAHYTIKCSYMQLGKDHHEHS